MDLSTPPAGSAPATLPERASAALIRGVKCLCPRCGQAGLFRKWLKPVDTCPHCGIDWSVQQADDFPAYIGIFVVGHLLAPVIIFMIATLGLSAWLTLALMLPVAAVLLIAMLQPTKGAVIAFLWWQGVGAFVQERPSPMNTDTPMNRDTP